MVKVGTTLAQRKFNRQSFMTNDPQQSKHANFFPTEAHIRIGGGLVTEKQLQEFRRSLVELLKESMARFKETNRLLRNGSPINPSDETSRENDRDHLLPRLDQVKQTVGEIHQALNRIKNGNYGKCVACKGWISVQRLEAFPTARFCLQCQRVIGCDCKK